MNLRIKKELPQGYEFSQLAASIQADYRVAGILQIVEGVVETIAISAMLQYLCGHIGLQGSLVQVGCTVVAALAALALQWQFGSNLRTHIRVKCDPSMNKVNGGTYATTALMTGLLCLALNSLGAFLVYQNFNPSPTLSQHDSSEYKQALDIAQINYDNAQVGILTMREQADDIGARWEAHIKSHPNAASWAALQMKKEKAPILKQIAQAEQTAQTAYRQAVKAAQTANKKQQEQVKQENKQLQTSKEQADAIALVFAVLGSLILLCLIWVLTTRATKTEVQTGVVYDVQGADHATLNNLKHAIIERTSRALGKLADKIRGKQQDKQPVLIDNHPKQIKQDKQDKQPEQVKDKQEQPQPIPQPIPSNNKQPAVVVWNGKELNKTDITNRLRTLLHRAHNSSEDAAKKSNMDKFTELSMLAQNAGFVVTSSVSDEKQERTKKTKDGVKTVFEYKVKVKVK